MELLQSDKLWLVGIIIVNRVYVWLYVWLTEHYDKNSYKETSAKKKKVEMWNDNVFSILLAN